MQLTLNKLVPENQMQKLKMMPKHESKIFKIVKKKT